MKRKSKNGVDSTPNKQNLKTFPANGMENPTFETSPVRVVQNHLTSKSASTR